MPVCEAVSAVPDVLFDRPECLGRRELSRVTTLPIFGRGLFVTVPDEGLVCMASSCL